MELLQIFLSDLCKELKEAANNKIPDLLEECT